MINAYSGEKEWAVAEAHHAYECAARAEAWANDIEAEILPELLQEQARRHAEDLRWTAVAYRGIAALLWRKARDA